MEGIITQITRVRIAPMMSPYYRDADGWNIDDAITNALSEISDDDCEFKIIGKHATILRDDCLYFKVFVEVENGYKFQDFIEVMSATQKYVSSLLELTDIARNVASTAEDVDDAIRVVYGRAGDRDNILSDIADGLADTNWDYGEGEVVRRVEEAT